MKKSSLIIACLCLSILVVALPKAIAENNGAVLKISTDKPAYVLGSLVMINGSLTCNGAAIAGKLVSVQVFDPSGNLITATTLSTDLNGNCDLQFRIRSDPGTITGFYNVLAQADVSQVTVKASTTFQVRTITKSNTTVVSFSSVLNAYSITTLTATVSGYNTTGSITWSSNDSTGGFYPPMSSLSSGITSTTFNDTKTGIVTITAIYSGDTFNTVSNSSIVLKVYPAGDFTHDGVVDGQDFLYFMSAYIDYQTKRILDPACDLNNDGKIDGSDFLVFMADYVSFWANSNQ